MTHEPADSLPNFVRARLLARNERSSAFFAREAPALAAACRQMAARFARGGRLLAFGRGAYATDAQHVAVEFVHPVIVGKRALPAFDLSAAFAPWLDATVGPDDMVMGFGPPGGDPEVQAALARAAARGAMAFALPGSAAQGYGVRAPSDDPFIHQELIEILYHTLWETVHVFFEHGGLEHGDSRNRDKDRQPSGPAVADEAPTAAAPDSDLGASGFLYPFLSEGGSSSTADDGVNSEVARSIVAKAAEVAALREALADAASGQIADAINAMRERFERGGRLLAFGNGGSATDANDLVLDCIAPPAGLPPVPAVSLAMESATVSAIANDVGAEVVFLRQLLAHARPGDIAVAFSTSGRSANIVRALREARRLGLYCVALVGYDGGEIAAGKLADACIVVPSDYIPRIQEAQASVYHVIREGLAGEAQEQHSEEPARELFGAASCPYTAELREELDWRGLEYRYYDVERDSAALERMLTLTGGSRTVPVLVEGGVVVEIGFRGRGCIVAPPAGEE